MVLRTLAVVSCLCLSLTAGSLWGQSQVTQRIGSPSATSNIEGWQDEESNEPGNEWTWFGMSFELRNRAMNRNHSIAAGIPIKRTNSKK